MPRLPDVPNVLRLVLSGSKQGQPWAAVQYARFTGASPGSAELATAAAAVGTAWQSALAQIHTAEVLLTSVTCIDLTRLDAAVGSASMNHAGSRVGTALPNQVALVASYKINVRYRGGHPRTYWPAGAQADITNGRLWTSGFLTLADGACTDYVGDINAITLGGGLLIFSAVSYFSGTDPGTGKPIMRTTPLVFPVTTVEVHPRVDTQRRRLGKETL